MGVAVKLRFILTQHVRDERLMKSLVKFFSCGNVHFSKKAVNFAVEKFSDLVTKSIPFLLNIQSSE